MTKPTDLAQAEREAFRALIDQLEKELDVAVRRAAVQTRLLAETARERNAAWTTLAALKDAINVAARQVGALAETIVVRTTPSEPARKAALEVNELDDAANEAWKKSQALREQAVAAHARAEDQRAKEVDVTKVGELAPEIVALGAALGERQQISQELALEVAMLRARAAEIEELEALAADLRAKVEASEAALAERREAIKAAADAEMADRGCPCEQCDRLRESRKNSRTSVDASANPLKDGR